jgi:2-amino-4-hydroxy-6-hydroxymethyldihydropteridine diphosphokinase
MPRIGIALGSNLGSRLRNLQRARDLLAGIATPGEPVLLAPIYQTEPVHCPSGSPDFLNTVVEISWEGLPTTLLDLTQAIEFKLGRLPTSEPNAPRVIDVDLLYFGDQTLDAGLLVLPHPRITGRRFVLQPLADIRPDLILAGHQATIADHLRHIDTAEPPLMLVQECW